MKAKGALKGKKRLVEKVTEEKKRKKDWREVLNLYRETVTKNKIIIEEARK